MKRKLLSVLLAGVLAVSAAWCVKPGFQNCVAFLFADGDVFIFSNTSSSQDCLYYLFHSDCSFFEVNSITMIIF